MKGWQIVGILGGVAIAYGCQTPITLSQQSAQSIEHTHEAVRVMRIVSGQTIEVQPFNSTTALNQTIRLKGIQAPDPRQSPWGEAAKEHLETLLLGQTVYLSPEAGAIDDYDRRWANVWFQGNLINQTLVSEGLALVDEQSGQSHDRSTPSHAETPNHSSRLNHAQHRARTLGLGIWNPQNPMRQTPHDFRKQQT